jgi:hypothetical protein
MWKNMEKSGRKNKEKSPKFSQLFVGKQTRRSAKGRGGFFYGNLQLTPGISARQAGKVVSKEHLGEIQDLLERSETYVKSASVRYTVVDLPSLGNHV